MEREFSGLDVTIQPATLTCFRGAITVVAFYQKGVWFPYGQGGLRWWMRARRCGGAAL